MGIDHRPIVDTVLMYISFFHSSNNGTILRQFWASVVDVEPALIHGSSGIVSLINAHSLIPTNMRR